METVTNIRKIEYSVASLVSSGPAPQQRLLGSMVPVPGGAVWCSSTPGQCCSSQGDGGNVAVVPWSCPVLLDMVVVPYSRGSSGWWPRAGSLGVGGVLPQSSGLAPIQRLPDMEVGPWSRPVLQDMVVVPYSQGRRWIVAQNWLPGSVRESKDGREL